MNAQRLLAVVVAAATFIVATTSDDAARAIATESPQSSLGESVVQGSVCLSGTTPRDLSGLFDLEPAGLVGGDYQRAHPLSDGRVLWTFQDGAVRIGTGAIVIVHNVGVLQDGPCFQVLYGGTRQAPSPFLFADRTVPFHRWFWPLDAELGNDGLLYIFVAEMLETSNRYLVRTVPQGAHVAVFDPTDDTVVSQIRPADSSASLYGWSITSDADWTYMYAQCFRQFGFDEYAIVPAFDSQCSPRVTVARVPRGQLLDVPTYWDGSVWQADSGVAASVIETTGRRINANQIEWTGGSFVSINKEGDWWGDRIYFAQSPSATGPFVVFDSVTAPVKCADCNSFFASWIPGSAVARPPSTLVFGLSHNRWDGVISAAYRPSFHEIAAPRFLPAGRTFELEVPNGTDLDAAVLNVIAVDPAANGYVTVFPCDRERPVASNLNYGPSDVVANLVVTRPSADGVICLFSLADTDLVVDFAGAFEKGSGFDPVDNPLRLVDTRIGLGAPRQRLGAGEAMRVAVPGQTLEAAVLNLTAASPSGSGYLTVFPCDRDRPVASNVNYQRFDVVANLVAVRPDADGNVCVFSLAETDLVIDLAGGFGEGSGTEPVDNPFRLVDTRTGLGADTAIRVPARTTMKIAIPAAMADAPVVMNTTAVLPSGPGYLTVYPCDRERPMASNLNYAGADVVANLVVVRPDLNGNVCVFTLAETDLVIDLAGSITVDSGFVVADNPVRILDTRDGTGIRR